MQSASPRVWGLRILAAVLVAATARLVIVDLAALDAQARNLGPLVPVVIARHPLVLGARIRADDIAVEQRHRSQVPDHALRTVGQAVGRTVRVAMVAQTPVQSDNVSAQRAPGGSIASGFRAIRIADHSGIRPDPGTVIDIIASFQTSSSGPADTSTDAGGSHANTPSSVVARGAIVIPDTSTQNSHQISGTFSAGDSASAIIVLVRDREVEPVAFAAAFGVITIVLAPSEEACCATK